jgi:hypothetical protein
VLGGYSRHNFVGRRAVVLRFSRAVGGTMRAPHVIAIIAIAILAVGARMFLFPPKSEAIFSDAGLDVYQMHKDKNMQKIPVQDMSDMSLVFDRNNYN